MSPRPILLAASALLLGGALVVAWPRYGPCLTGRQVVALKAGQSTPVGCPGSRLTFDGWSDGAAITLSCPETRTTRLSAGTPRTEICGLGIELLGHDIDPRVGGDQVRLAVEAL